MKVPKNTGVINNLIIAKQEIIYFTNNYRLKTNDGMIQAYRKRLLDTGVIATARRGEVEFTLPYFNEFLNNSL